MHNLVLFCKTFKNDYHAFILLLESFLKYNADNLPFYVSVPREDFSLFSAHEAPNVHYITDESYMEQYAYTECPEGGLSLGYLNQEICKLAFHEVTVLRERERERERETLCRHYLCLDSDCRFIRPFYFSDFMHDENTPYTVLVMDKDLLIERHYRDYGKDRHSFIEKIYHEVGLGDDRRLRTCHGMQVLSSEVLASLKNDFMKSKNYTYQDLLNIAPFEFTWYNAWFQKCKLVPEYAVEPFFKTFGMRIEYIFSRCKSLRLEDYAKQYVGIILNGNWKPKKPPSFYGEISFLDKVIYKICSWR